jgi:phosphoribosylcarboxyaminoimidazole (NCAIR) mutase
MPRPRIGVIHMGSILQVSFTGRACEAYSTVRVQYEHILQSTHLTYQHILCFIVGEICIVH